MGGEPLVPAILVSQEEKVHVRDTKQLGLYARVLALTAGSTTTESDYNTRHPLSHLGGVLQVFRLHCILLCVRYKVATMSPDLNGAGADPGAGAGINGGDARGAGVGTGGSGGLPRDSPWRR